MSSLITMGQIQSEGAFPGLNAALNDQSDSTFTNRCKNQDKTPERESKALLKAPISHLYGSSIPTRSSRRTSKKANQKKVRVFTLPNELIMDAEEPQDDPQNSGNPFNQETDINETKTRQSQQYNNNENT